MCYIFTNQKNYSIICLQDTHFVEKEESYIQTEWGYKCIFKSHNSNSRGVAILFNNNFEFCRKSYALAIRDISESAGNLIALAISIDNNRVTLIKQKRNAYMDPMMINHCSTKRKCIILMESDNIFHIVCGDMFNISLNQNLDTDNYKHTNNPKSRDFLLKMMSELASSTYLPYLPTQ